MKTFKKIVLFLLIMIFLIFSFQNRSDIQIAFFKWSVFIPTSLLIVATYVLGMFTGGILWMLIKALTIEKPKPTPTVAEKDKANTMI